MPEKCHFGRSESFTDAFISLPEGGKRYMTCFPPFMNTENVDLIPVFEFETLYGATIFWRYPRAFHLKLNSASECKLILWMTCAKSRLTVTESRHLILVPSPLEWQNRRRILSSSGGGGGEGCEPRKLLRRGFLVGSLGSLGGSVSLYLSYP